MIFYLAWLSLCLSGLVYYFLVYHSGSLELFSSQPAGRYVCQLGLPDGVNRPHSDLPAGIRPALYATSVSKPAAPTLQFSQAKKRKRRRIYEIEKSLSLARQLPAHLLVAAASALRFLRAEKRKLVYLLLFTIHLSPSQLLLSHYDFLEQKS